MNLVGELKNKVEKAHSPEEKKQLIMDAGMELTNDELDLVIGGVMSPDVIQRHAIRGDSVSDARAKEFKSRS